MDKSLKLFLILFAVLMISFFAVLFYMSKRADNKNLAYSFSGVVETVEYDIKGIPTVKIDNREYYLSAFNFEYKIKTGDSMKKEQGKNVYTLIKQKTGEIIFFDN